MFDKIYNIVLCLYVVSLNSSKGGDSNIKQFFESHDFLKMADKPNPNNIDKSILPVSVDINLFNMRIIYIYI